MTQPNPEQRPVPVTELIEKVRHALEQTEGTAITYESPYYSKVLNAVPTLCDLAESLREENRRLREALEEIKDVAEMAEGRACSNLYDMADEALSPTTPKTEKGGGDE